MAMRLLFFTFIIHVRPAVSTRLHFGQEVVPSASIEALMQHFQAAGFSKEVYSLAPS